MPLFDHLRSSFSGWESEERDSVSVRLTLPSMRVSLCVLVYGNVRVLERPRWDVECKFPFKKAARKKNSGGDKNSKRSRQRERDP